MKRKTLSIVHRGTEDFLFEDLPAEELGNGLAIGKSAYNLWCIFDVKSGLLVISNKTTKKVALMKYEQLIHDKERMEKVAKARESLTYKDRVLAMELHAHYR